MTLNTDTNYKAWRSAMLIIHKLLDIQKNLDILTLLGKKVLLTQNCYYIEFFRLNSLLTGIQNNRYYLVLLLNGVLLYRGLSVIELYILKMQQQQDVCHWSFWISFSFELYSGSNHASIQFRQIKLRTHYQRCMDIQLMSSFPQTPRDEQLVYQARRLNRKYFGCEFKFYLNFNYDIYYHFCLYLELF